MKTILDRLKEYFENTSSEQVKEDWKKTEKYDQVNSPPVGSFFQESKRLIDVGKLDENLPSQSFINNFKNPSFSSDFFF
jgi:hypothetical protein